MAIWIDLPYFSKVSVGSVAFLIGTLRQEARQEALTLSEHPAHTNQSREPRLNGWCGSTNNVSTYGRGVVRVARVTKNDRALVVSLEGDELTAALESLGYPDLA